MPAETMMQDGLVVFKTSQSLDMQATLLKLTRFQVAFEVCGPAVLRTSEVLQDFPAGPARLLRARRRQRAGQHRHGSGLRGGFAGRLGGRRFCDPRIAAPGIARRVRYVPSPMAKDL